MIAIDWSHTKDLTTYDGKKIRVEDKKALLARLSIAGLKSMRNIVLEQGCPLSLIYGLTRMGCQVKLIDNKATEYYRKEHGLEKSDETDARIIYELSNNGAKLQSINMDDRFLQMHDLYHQYCRYQKARIAMQNMKKAHQRQYGIGESTSTQQSAYLVHPDLLPYDIAIDTLHAREKSLLKSLESITRGESTSILQSYEKNQPPNIKGLGKRIWIGLLVTANPKDFKCLSSYLRFCGLVDMKQLNHKYNRHARMLYHMLAESIMKAKDAKFRAIYDKCKVDIAEKHSDYTKGHIHNAALNRTATFLAKEIFNTMAGESM